ncbi:exported hypothetical protein [Aeromicrobium sp. 9AM]|nr:exported hypothetical protein [Aeromicrobium sp. 9AM]
MAMTIGAGTLAAMPAEAATAPVAHGTVTAAEGSGPIVGITVCATHRNARGDYGAQRCTETAADGTYTIPVTSSLWSISAEQRNLYGAWLPQDYNNRKAYSFATSPSRTFNFALVRGATISGYLSPPESGPRIDYTHVGAHRVGSTGKVDKTATSFSNVSSDGYYRVAKLPAGTYKLLVDDGYSPVGYANQWYPDAAAASGGERVTVGTGQSVTGRDISLSLAGSLTIALHSPKGSSLKGDLRVYDVDGRVVYVGDGDYTTAHTIVGLHPGVYKVRASPYDVSGYQEWFSWKRTFGTANPITVTSGGTTSRTLTFHYPTIKATKRPVVRLDANSIVTSHAKWNVKPRYVRYEWWRDGKRIEYEGWDWRLARKSDVGHRFKVCQFADRSGYADGRTCSDYSKKVTTY